MCEGDLDALKTPYVLVWKPRLPIDYEDSKDALASVVICVSFPEQPSKSGAKIPLGSYCLLLSVRYSGARLDIGLPMGRINLIDSAFPGQNDVLTTGIRPNTGACVCLRNSMPARLT